LPGGTEEKCKLGYPGFEHWTFRMCRRNANRRLITGPTEDANPVTAVCSGVAFRFCYSIWGWLWGVEFRGQLSSRIKTDVLFSGVKTLLRRVLVPQTFILNCPPVSSLLAETCKG